MKKILFAMAMAAAAAALSSCEGRDNEGPAYDVDVEAAILERLDNPLAFEPYPSVKKRKFPYYRIYVRNYVIYYVVIGEVMEVRRFLYRARDTERFL